MENLKSPLPSGVKWLIRISIFILLAFLSYWYKPAPNFDFEGEVSLPIGYSQSISGSESQYDYIMIRHGKNSSTYLLNEFIIRDYVLFAQLKTKKSSEDSILIYNIKERSIPLIMSSLNYKTFASENQYPGEDSFRTFEVNYNNYLQNRSKLINVLIP